MSNLQSKMAGVRFEAVGEQPSPPVAEGTIILGVVYPAVIIALELASHMCAQALFDPVPTYAHALAVFSVPAVNLLVWKHLWDGSFRKPNWLAFANGIALAIAGFYALLFLPLAPLALVGILVLIGVLPLAPLFAFGVAVKLSRALLARHAAQPLWRPLAGGVAVGVLCVLALDVPATVTRLAMQSAVSEVPEDRERGLALLRAVGDDDLLLRLSYGMTGQPNGPLSAFVMYRGDSLFARRGDQPALSSAQAREVYYRVHGVPFNTKPVPRQFGQSRFAGTQFDGDHGGTQVGGQVEGISLASSRIDGSISADDAVAYLEWTVEVRNTAPLAREARLQLALPPDAVVSRATLWVNGEEREAAYGGRGEVRAAYQRVAVRQRRDPLLVTTRGADRVLAQAFPVPAGGGTIKFKIGITAPLEMVDASYARLTLPAMIERNFVVAPDMRHSVWIESKQLLVDSGIGLASSRGAGEQYRLSGPIDDVALSRPRATITVARAVDMVSRAARIGDGETVVQEVQPATAQPAALMLVIDGSARLAATSSQLVRALDAIPSNMKVGVIVATDATWRAPLAPWSRRYRKEVAALLRSAPFVGGQDNAPALADALQALEAEPNATLLWIHGPQPLSFAGGAARLEQAVARLKQLPGVMLYGVEPGPNETLPDAPWAWGAHSLPQTNTVEADLARFFRSLSADAKGYVIRRTPSQATDGAPKGSEHIARLWARDRVLELMRANASANRAEAVALASRYRLVTPVSGAVVLESQQQYVESRLTPVSQATVPTVPEPHEWALIIIACASLTWFAWRNRQRLAFA